MLRGNSAPNSPTSFELKRDVHVAPHHQTSGLPTPAQAPEANVASDATVDAARPTTPAALSSDVESSSPRQPRSGRTRVGFSDKLEFIPRPLSMVSSDTSSTATARPGHSVSGSISSVVSVASPCDRESPVTLSKNSTRDLSDSRPSTAGAILERMAAPPNRNVANTSPRRRNSNPTLLSVAEAQAADPNNPVATIKAPKRWSFFGLESSFIGPTMPMKPRSLSSSSSESVSRAASAPSSSDHDSDSTETGRDLHAANADKQSSKTMSKKKRVRGWAGSILPLKPRGQKKQVKANGLRPPTPPASVDPLEEEDDDDDETEETEDSETPDPEGTPGKDLNAESSAPERVLASPQPQPLSKDDASHPMIDLDAALGPFNTPLPHNAEWEAAQRAAGTTGKRRMHSAQGMKGFSGPGMHYHRRSESAPDLPPFDPGRSNIHRLNSNSAMADVFEEDEDDVAAANGQPKKPGAASMRELHRDGAATSPVVLASVEASPLLRASPIEPAYAAMKRASSEPIESAMPPLTPLAAECPTSSVHGEAAVEDPPSIIFCSASASGPDSATSSPKRLPGTKELTPVEVYPASHSSTAMMPLSPYSTSLASSSHPSPRSPVSIDAQRISTAPSSVTDKNSFQSLLMGEPGPEVRISADYDIRSLTSSNSTMTRDSSFIPSQRMSQPTLREQRPVSVSSAAFGRRRSSLVSLSRLISSAHGERSKLSMEVTLDNESESKKPRSKGSKTKERLGRMMQFWKPSKGGAPA
ncbi:cell wall proline rich protein [Hirsutella rhossiliensis]|uniref:Cell wall proline rich protein n=1 Tax=Hirsutella rhossiliensis TaxID=111463 RepID=A0A9P8MXK2_9HYPO|nr:cell wall proline rich protein [Hirsutella rhossiliensis]KAH0963182.1 cell wall proline rich protein [Hirsutella rhossiliensis]